MKFLYLIFAILFSNFAIAGFQQDFEELKNQGRNLQDTGAICEEVARISIQRTYGSGYTVLSGIEYADLDGTAGELDIIVFDNKTNIAVQIGEVKCWQNMQKGLRKANDQRQRFQRYVNSSRAVFFQLKENPKLRFTKQQFNKNPEFVAIAQKGSRAAGYDIELPYSLNQLMDLREMIIKCQSSGTCRKPLH